MPRFSDDWVVDRTLFDYVSGGTCACCGFPHLYPDGVAGLINSISDLETDAAQAEVSAMQQSPWPPDMKDQVWGDRVRLRYKLKKEMRKYRDFWEKHGEGMARWCREEMSGKSLKKLVQMPRTGVTERLNSQYGIHSAYGIVLCTVVEQVSKFEVTKYPTDARGDSETAFEKALVFDRRGGFTLRIVDNDGNLDEDVLNVWLGRMKSLGGPKLLERGPSTTRPDDGEEDEDGGGVDSGDDTQDHDMEGTTRGPSFRGDRRIVRLLIARYWADLFMQKYLADINEAEPSNEEKSDEVKRLASGETDAVRSKLESLSFDENKQDFMESKVES